MSSGLHGPTGFHVPVPESRAGRVTTADCGCPLRHPFPYCGRLRTFRPDRRIPDTSCKTPALAGAFALRLRLMCAAFFAAVCCAAPAAAQSPQFALGTSAVDSVPQTTVVPVQQPSVRIVEHTTVYEDPTRGMTRPERRAYKAKVYAQSIDSLVQSRDYMFFPNSMQEIPGGMIRSIYADYFFFGVFVDHVEIHLPTERGITQYVEMLNFDSMSVRSYQAAHLQWGWRISFDIADGDALYHADLAVSTATGETVLTLITPRVTMRYVGWLWNKRIDDPKFRRID